MVDFIALQAALNFEHLFLRDYYCEVCPALMKLLLFLLFYTTQRT